MARGAVFRSASLLLALGTLSVCALDPTLRISQYHKQNWQIESGLPHSYTQLRDGDRSVPRGDLLVGTDEGLVRFDGVTFRPLRADASLKLSRRWISAMLTDHNGALWLGSFDGILASVRDGVTGTRIAGVDSVFDILEDSTGRIWASTRSGMIRVEHGRMERVRGLRPPAQTAWNVLARDTGGAVWIVTSEGLFSFRDGTLTREIPNGAGHGDTLAKAARSGGRMMVGTTQGIFELKGRSLVRAGDVPGPGGQHPQGSRRSGVGGHLGKGHLPRRSTDGGVGFARRLARRLHPHHRRGSRRRLVDRHAKRRPGPVGRSGSGSVRHAGGTAWQLRNNRRTRAFGRSSTRNLARRTLPFAWRSTGQYPGSRPDLVLCDPCAEMRSQRPHLGRQSGRALPFRCGPRAALRRSERVAIPPCIGAAV